MQREPDGADTPGSFPEAETVRAQLRERGVDLPEGRVTVSGYGDSPELSASLIGLITAGRKTAGSALLWALEHDGEAPAEVGDLEVIVDFHGAPVVVTRVTESRIVPFLEVGAEYAALEGEGDLSLAYWRDAHRGFFGRECARIGRTPDDAMPVACTVFEVIAVVPPEA